MLTPEQKRLILSTLKPYQPEQVGVFGSYSRGEETDISDLDLLVQFKDRISLLKLVQLEQELSDMLKIKVQLITANAIRNKYLRASIYKDLTSISQ